ncbi:GDP-L-fucose synthase [Caldifermentibacillus hisashii]|uniref:GDP-L-fucose synthase n=1 Tax=Geobacillus sp. (strain WCH70) TaxID=471223 RepID=C5DAY6_GEOSW
MDRKSRIFVAGHRGLVGSAILRKLKEYGYENIITRSRNELDLTKFDDVEKFFQEERIDYVFLAAAKVGGILANDTYPADFLRENILIQNNVIHNAYTYGVKKLLFLGSSCIYPKYSKQPIKEDYLLTGKLEPTNEWYAIAKIAGIKMAQAYSKQYGFNVISLMPANLYGPNDNFDLKTSHVLPALLRKFHEAKVNNMDTVTIWGTGTPRREFLHVDDLADACIFLMNNYDSPEIINVGTGKDISILKLAQKIKEIVGFKGRIVTDTSKPDGTPRKLLDITKLNNLGWKSKIPLSRGIEETYSWFLENKDKLY